MAVKTFYTPNEIGAALAASQNGQVPQIQQVAIASSSAVATTQMQGLAIYFTPLNSSRVKLVITGQIAPAATTVWNVYPSYGTGTAPANAAATAGTQLTYGAGGTAATGTQVDSFSTYNVITGLSVGTTYWFDLETVFSVSTMGALTKLTIVIGEI
jgi:hypothetical protein